MSTVERDLAAIRADLKSATTELRAQCKELDALIRGNDQQPGIATRLSIVEENDRRRGQYLRWMVSAVWSALVALTVAVVGALVGGRS